MLVVAHVGRSLLFCSSLLLSQISLSLTLKHASSITPAVASIPLTTGGLCVMCFWYRQSAAGTCRLFLQKSLAGIHDARVFEVGDTLRDLGLCQVKPQTLNALGCRP